MEMLRGCFMLQQPERFKGQQKSPGASANSSSRCGRRDSTSDKQKETAGRRLRW